MKQDYTPAEQFVRHALSIGALELVPEGRTLKSGRVSPYFFNSGLFNTGSSISFLAKSYAAAMYGIFYPEVIFGPAYKGIPLATAVSQTFDRPVGYAFNRKEAKSHGEGGIIVGMQPQGKKIVIVDDVMTTGTSSGEAVEIIKTNGGIPIGCVIAFDRQERGSGDLSAVQEFQKNYGIPVCAAATLADLISVLARPGNERENGVLGKIIMYRDQYGVS